MRSILALALVAVLLAGGCEQQTTEKPAPLPEPEAPKFPTSDDPAMKTKAPEVFQVKFTTSEGNFVMELHRAWAPHGVDRFYNLVTHGFYDDTRIFRVVEDFVVQFGISGDAAISREWFSAGFDDDPVRQKNTVGMVTFAKANLPRSRTTQIFVNTANNSAKLDIKGFAPIGKVVEGLAVVQGLTPTTPDADPLGRTPDQNRIAGMGNTYLDTTFPKLCRILSAKVVK